MLSQVCWDPVWLLWVLTFLENDFHSKVVIQMYFYLIFVAIIFEE